MRQIFGLSASFLVAVCLMLPTASQAGVRCGLVDGVVDGSTDADTDEDGIPDCLDDLPLVPGNPPDACVYVVDTFEDGNDGECSVDCTLREALSLANGMLCTIRLAAGTYQVTENPLIGLGGLAILGGIAIVGESAHDTIIDAETTEPAITYQLGGSDPALLAGLTLEHDNRGIRHEAATDLVLNNIILRGNPAGGGGSALSNTGLLTLLAPVELRNSIIRDGGGIRYLAPGWIRGYSCLITNNTRGVWLGGSVYDAAEAYLTDCEVSSNSLGGFLVKAAGPSGPSGAPGFLLLRRTLVKNNGASADRGGAIFLDGSSAGFGGGRAWIFDSSLEDNQAVVAGGAIYIEGGASSGALRIEKSTLRDNSAPLGGAIYVDYADGCGHPTIETSTLTGNSASSAGGAVYYEDGCGGGGFLHSTVVGNEAPTGGALYNEGTGQPDLELTILADNVATTGPDCFGTFDSAGHNLIGDLSGCTFLDLGTDLLGVAPQLGPLAHNGGPTLSYSPEPGSPVIDAGPDTCDETDLDQRGVPRPQGAACDIGSIDYAPDTDGDLIVDPLDNCAEVANAAQIDSDFDGIGDLCDNCPFTANSDQSDGDDDGAGTACDCHAGHPLILPPPPVQELTLSREVTGDILLAWSVTKGADWYRLTTGVLSALDSGDYGECVEGSITGTTHQLSDEDPDPGQGRTYLVIGYSSSCGSGSIGFTSEAARVNTNPNACP